MHELADSRGLASDPAALRARLAADGYVFLRGLLPAGRVRAAGEQVAATLRAGGWTAAGSPLLGRAAGPREALADPAYRAAVTSLAFNALPYLAPGRDFARLHGGPEGNAMKPWAQRSTIAQPERPGPANQHQERGLKCIFHGVRITQYLSTHGQDHRPMTGQKRLKRRCR